MELQKLERRLARNLNLIQIEEAASTAFIPDNNSLSSSPPPLSLPLPRDPPEVLIRSPDYKSKVRFLRGLGLEALSRKDREGKFFMHASHKNNCFSFPQLYDKSLVIIYIVYYRTHLNFVCHTIHCCYFN